MKNIAVQLFFILFFVPLLHGQTNALPQTEKIINEVIGESYPELKTKKIEVKTFKSESDYFKSRFAFGKMLTFQKMRYIIFVNPKVFEKNAPENGIS
jgi:hypothetical protein